MGGTRQAYSSEIAFHAGGLPKAHLHESSAKTSFGPKTPLVRRDPLRYEALFTPENLKPSSSGKQSRRTQIALVQDEISGGNLEIEKEEAAP